MLFLKLKLLRIHLPLKKGRFESLGDSISGDLGAHSSNFSSHSRSIPMVQSPSQPDPDPYEFSDEASKDPKTLTTRSRPSRDERPSPLGKMVCFTSNTSLFTFYCI